MDRRAILTGLAALSLAPAWAEDTANELPEGYPPKMGEIDARVGRKPVRFETFDFSVGAFDASAWVALEDRSRKLTLIGYPKGPEGRRGRLRIVGYFPGEMIPGKLLGPLGEIYDGEGLDGHRMSTLGNPTEVVVEALEREAGAAYGRVRGRITGTLCPRGGKNGVCKSFEARFDTAVQFDGV